MSEMSGAHSDGSSELDAATAQLLQLEYEQTTQLMFTFFEWRHKIITRYALSVAGIALAIKYVYERKLGAQWQMIPFAAGAAVSVVAALLDRVHQRIIDGCYANGLRLEKFLPSLECRADPPSECRQLGMYGQLNSIFGKRFFTPPARSSQEAETQLPLPGVPEVPGRRMPICDVHPSPPPARAFLEKALSYRVILQWLFLGGGVAFVCGGVAVALWAPH